MPTRTATPAALLPTGDDAVAVVAKFFRALDDRPGDAYWSS
jgi:hypothetical protein